MAFAGSVAEVTRRSNIGKKVPKALCLANATFRNIIFDLSLSLLVDRRVVAGRIGCIPCTLSTGFPVGHNDRIYVFVFFGAPVVDPGHFIV